ncbi:isochorismatase family protein [Streptomyces sp. NPDC002755]
MHIDRRSADNTGIILIDYVTGFANVFGSQSVSENINGAVALAKMALGYEVPLVATLGPVQDPRGPLYPELSEALGAHPLVHRGGSFDAFDHPGFEEAVEALDRKHLVIAGLMTEGCVLHTALGALRRDYEVSVVIDATAGETQAIHDAAMTRLVQAGVTPTSWLSLASEFQVTYDDEKTVGVYYDLLALKPGMNKNLHALQAAVSLGQTA